MKGMQEIETRRGSSWKFMEISLAYSGGIKRSKYAWFNDLKGRCDVETRETNWPFVNQLCFFKAHLLKILSP